jgi:hypothetical protein
MNEKHKSRLPVARSFLIGLGRARLLFPLAASSG